MKREFSMIRIVFGAPITARVQPLDGGVRVEIYGGTRPHIGAVSVADPEGKITTREFSGHREGVVTARWAEVFGGAGFSPAVILAGIHYDGSEHDDIRKVLAVVEDMLGDAVEQMKC